MHVQNPMHLCGRKTRGGSGTCHNPPMRGQTVCRMHGGTSPQAKLKAEQRLALMVDPVLTELYRIALAGETDGVRLAAGKDLLDRAGLKPTERVQADQELTIRILREEQPIILEKSYRALSNGRADD